MTGPTQDIVGREAELRSVLDFVAPAEPWPRALVLEGDAGIGKTTLWERGVRAGRSAGLRVLAAKPAPGESDSSFGALGDLLADVAEEVLPRLPAPQRRALAIALLLEESAGPPVEPRAVGTAVLGAVGHLADDAPVLLAIDDVQWLDASSASVLSFAVRRLREERVALLLARRDTSARTELDRALPVDWRLDMSLGPLSIGALHHMLTARLGVAFPRPTLLRLYETSAGNPFYALELGRALARRGDGGAARDLPLSPTLLELVDARLGDLPDGVEEALRAAAAMGAATVDRLEALVPGARERLEAAVEQGVVSIEAGRVAFTHPLLQSGVLARTNPARLRGLHRQLAEVAATDEERGRHLALSADGPSEEVAAALAAAAAGAASRGAPSAAGEMLEQAARLTPSSSQQTALERTLDAAWQHLTAGSSERAWGLLEPILETAPPGRLRARATLYATDRPLPFDQRIELLVRATDEVEGDTVLLAELEREAAEDLMLTGDVEQALERARRATQLSEEAGDRALLVQCLGTVCAFETAAAAVTPGLIERAVALEAETHSMSTIYSPSQMLGLRLLYADRLEEARGWLERALRWAEANGEEFQRRNCHLYLVQLEIRGGNWAQAERHADEAEVVGEQLLRGREPDRFARALVDTHLGRTATARAAAEEGIAAADAGGRRIFGVLNRWVLGLLELSLGDAIAAAALLRPLPAELAAMGYRDPSVRPVLPDAIEALIGVAEFDAADPLVDELETRGRELDNPWAIATATRCRGMLEAARGQLSAAVATLERALVEHERAASPFERGRTLLVLGQVRRRAKQRRAARAALDAALAIFDELPAPLWADKARAELARISGRGPASAELTETERRVAELVAEGRSNPEVAAALFITRQTVEKHLTRIYAKLGVRSRVELVRRFAAGERTRT